MEADKKRLIVLVALLVVSAVGVYAASTFYSASSDVTLGVDPGPDITLGQSADLESGTGPDPAGFVNISTKNHGYTNFSGTADTTARVTDLGGEWTNLSSTSVGAGELQIEPDTAGTHSIEGGTTSWSYRSINYSQQNDSRTEIVYSASSTTTLVLENTGQSQGTGIVAVDSSGNPLDSNATNADGSVVLELPSGSKNVNIKVGPSTLEIRNVQDTSELVDNVKITIRFYEDGGQEDLVVEKTTSNGVVDFTGLPLDQAFVASANATGWQPRRVYISSLTEQQTMYLLNNSVTDVFNRFVLNDKSGEFQTSHTRLTIERAVNESGSLQWKVVSGDYFGASNEHAAYLEFEQRYRMFVTNDQGDRRFIGSYTANDENNPKQLTISEVVTKPPDGREYYGTAYVKNESGQTKLWFSYSDPKNETSELRLNITNRSDPSDVLVDTTVTTVGDSFVFSQNVSPNTAWKVNWTVVRDGEEKGPNVQVVGARGRFPLPIDTVWLQRFFIVIIPFLAALSTDRTATYGALGLVGLIGAAMVLQWYTINPILWVAAFVIAAGGHAMAVSSRRGPVG
jgi:hypothetical protein